MMNGVCARIRGRRKVERQGDIGEQNVSPQNVSLACELVQAKTVKLQESQEETLTFPLTP